MVAAMNKMAITCSDNRSYNDWDSFSYFAFQQEGYETYDRQILKEFIPALNAAGTLFWSAGTVAGGKEWKTANLSMLTI